MLFATTFATPSGVVARAAVPGIDDRAGERGERRVPVGQDAADLHVPGGLGEEDAERPPRKPEVVGRSRDRQRARAPRAARPPCRSRSGRQGRRQRSLTFTSEGVGGEADAAPDATCPGGDRRTFRAVTSVGVGSVPSMPAPLSASSTAAGEFSVTLPLVAVMLPTRRSPDVSVSTMEPFVSRSIRPT